MGHKVYSEADSRLHIVSAKVKELLSNLTPSGTVGLRDVMVSTDPPYYDNIGYADLSDFFYVWMRQSLKETYPELFSTMLVPKAEELIATPYRHDGNVEEAKEFFEVTPKS